MVSNGPPPAPDVPGQQAIPEYHGMGLGQQELMKSDPNQSNSPEA